MLLSVQLDPTGLFFLLLHRRILHRYNQFSRFSVADAPTAASANNGSTSTSQSSNDLDIFGPMVSNPLPASSSAAQFSQVKREAACPQSSSQRNEACSLKKTKKNQEELKSNETQQQQQQ